MFAVFAISLCLLGLSATTAVSLLSQHRAINTVLGENVQSQRAAAELKECLHDLIALEDDGVERVGVLHNRLRQLFARLGELADQPEEQRLHGRMSSAFATYLTRRDELPPEGDPAHESARREATRYLESGALKPCEEFEQFNAKRVADSADQHERVLRQLAWGMAVVGLLGGVAGVVLGFGIARQFTRSIRRLQFQLRSAAGKLGPDLPDLVITENGDFGLLHAEIERLGERIERIVRELQARENEVIRAEQLAAVGQLAAGVAHEIRNPLTAIKLLVQAAQQDGGGIDNEESRVIEAEVRRMERSLNAFLDFARPPKLRRRSVDLGALTADVFELLRARAESQNVTLALDAPAEPVTASADPEQLRQVLVNLCLNALDSMPDSGRLEVSMTRARGEAHLEVADSGAGIPTNMFPRLFQPFASSKETGLGLGLVISKRIVEDHGGSVNAANRSEGGASFFVRLPAEVPRVDHPAS